MYKEKYEECRELYGGGGRKYTFLIAHVVQAVSGWCQGSQSGQCASSVPEEEAQKLRLSLGLGCLVSVLVGLRVGLVLFVVVDAVDVLQ